MEAPKTIFIPIVEEEDKRLLCTIWWEHDRTSNDKFVKETIKYIRKDALLDWAKEKRAALLNCDATEERKVAALSVCDAFIEKIKSL